MEDSTRIPPQAIDLEESVLGACMIEEDWCNTVIEELSPDDFYKPAHQHIYEAILELHGSSEQIDMLVIEQELRDNKRLQEAGGKGYLAELTRHASVGNVDNHCDIIKAKAQKRLLIRIGQQIVQDGYDSNTRSDELIDKAQEEIFALYNNESGTTYSLSESLSHVINQIEQIQESGKRQGIQTGLDIDSITMGFEAAKYYVIAARPSMGKTALVIDIMKRIAAKDYKPGILSLETSHDSLAFRLLTSESKISTEKLKTPGLTQTELNTILESANKISNYGIYLDDTLSLSDQQMRAKIRALIQKYGLNIVFIDFLQLLNAEANSREQEITKVSRAIKISCKECNIPVVALSQLSRGPENRSNKRPTLSDLRESGSIEQDADVVMFLYRPEYYGIEEYPDGESTKNVTEIIIAKNKDGRTGTKKLLFLKDEMRFYNLSTVERHERKSTQTSDSDYKKDTQEPDIPF